MRGIEGYKQSPFQGVVSLPFAFKMSEDRGGVVYLVAEAVLRLPFGLIRFGPWLPQAGHLIANLSLRLLG